MKTKNYTHNQAIQKQVHVVSKHVTIHKHDKNVIILTTSKYIYKIKKWSDLSLTLTITTFKFQSNGPCFATFIPSQVSVYLDSNSCLTLRFG